MCYQKFFEIVFSLQLASEGATSIGIVLVLFLFFDKVRGRDTTIFLQHIFAFIHILELNQTVHANMTVALPFLLLTSLLLFYFL